MPGGCPLVARTMPTLPPDRGLRRLERGDSALRRLERGALGPMSARTACKHAVTSDKQTLTLGARCWRRPAGTPGSVNTVVEAGQKMHGIICAVLRKCWMVTVTISFFFIIPNICMCFGLIYAGKQLGWIYSFMYPLAPLYFRKLWL